jgi:hypothetical protein
MQPTRRTFLESAVGGLALGCLSRLRPVSAAEAALDPSQVTIESGVEDIVRLLEKAPRERVIEEVASRISKGLGYRHLLAGLLVAGVRNVQPRPQVGFKFHAVLVINSAHLASIASPDTDRWLPILWAIDRFKSAQEETIRTSGWRMSAVDEEKVPPASRARGAFINAMDAWDESAADAAAAALARSAGRDECFELFARYGARDWRDIGHKAIFVSNSFRTLANIGWQNAEPVLRSLAYALLKYDGQNPSKSDQPADRPWRSNSELARKVSPKWQDGKPSPDVAKHLLSTFRTASPEDSAAAVVEALNNGASTASIWDSILSASAELLVRKTNILTLHSVTSSNALRFAFNEAADPQLRLMLLLQNASFLPLFRDAVGEKNLGKTKLDEMEPKPGGASPDPVAEIFADVSSDRPTAAARALAYLDTSGRPEPLMHAARRLVFFKGNDAHDYKFSSAVLEDYYSLSPGWRNRYLAASLFYLPGSGAADNPLVARIRAALSHST